MDDGDEDREADDGLAEPAAEPIGCAFLLLDQLLDPLALVLGQLAGRQHFVEGRVALDRLGRHHLLPSARHRGAAVIALRLAEDGRSAIAV